MSSIKSGEKAAVTHAKEDKNEDRSRVPEVNNNDDTKSMLSGIVGTVMGKDKVASSSSSRMTSTNKDTKAPEPKMERKSADAIPKTTPVTDGKASPPKYESKLQNADPPTYEKPNTPVDQFVGMGCRQR